MIVDLSLPYNVEVSIRDRTKNEEIKKWMSTEETDSKN